MTTQGKKMVAPVIITIVFILYLIFYGALLLQEAGSEPVMILFGIPLVLLGIGSIYMLIARIREVRICHLIT